MGKRIVLTGALSRRRAQVKADLEAQGAIVVADVSSTTDLLVAGARPGSKLERANELGIPVWSQHDLDAHLARPVVAGGSDAQRLASAARQNMETSARAAGVAEWARYEGLVRDRILVQVLKDKPREHGGLGQSRFGGCADLASLDAWPKADGLDFSFLCQVDLADIAAVDVAQRLPSSGLLSFFVGTPDVMGMHTEHRTDARVLYHPRGSALQPTWRSWGTSRQRGMAFVLSPAPPPWNSTLVGNDDPAYCDWYDAWEPQDVDRVRTAMLGFDRVYESELAATEQMLLSCWCDESIDYRFVEAVTLSFAIDGGALQRRDWSAVRCWEGCSI